MNKRDLIYGAASEAVMQSRIKLRRLLRDRLNDADLDEVETELYQAMCRAGQFALNAYDCDARKIKSVPQLINKL